MSEKYDVIVCSKIFKTKMNFKETKQDGRNIFKKGGNRMRRWSGDKS